MAAKTLCAIVTEYDGFFRIHRRELPFEREEEDGFGGRETSHSYLREFIFNASTSLRYSVRQTVQCNPLTSESKSHLILNKDVI